MIVFSLGSLGSTVGGAVRPVAANNQELSLSHVIRVGGANVKKALPEISVIAVPMVTMGPMLTSAQVVK